MTVVIVDMTPDPEIVEKVSCDNCGVRLEFVPRDRIQKCHTDYGGDSTYYDIIVCPNCDNKIEV